MNRFSLHLGGRNYARSRGGLRATQAAVILLLSGLFLLACEAYYSKATPFSRGQAIPMGNGSLSVAYVEETSQFAPGGWEKNLAVFLDSRDFYSLLQKRLLNKRLYVRLDLDVLAHLDRVGAAQLLDAEADRGLAVGPGHPAPAASRSSRMRSTG